MYRQSKVKTGLRIEKIRINSNVKTMAFFCTAVTYDPSSLTLRNF
jgi:hypothetical protein